MSLGVTSFVSGDGAAGVNETPQTGLQDERSTWESGHLGVVATTAEAREGSFLTIYVAVRLNFRP